MLNAKQKRDLKKLTHALKPIIMIGKKGISDNLRKEVEAALLAHELLKVKFLESAIEEQDDIIADLCQDLGAELVESRGHIASIYRSHPEKPKIII